MYSGTLASLSHCCGSHLVAGDAQHAQHFSPRNVHAPLILFWLPLDMLPPRHNSVLEALQLLFSSPGIHSDPISGGLDRFLGNLGTRSSVAYISGGRHETLHHHPHRPLTPGNPSGSCVRPSVPEERCISAGNWKLEFPLSFICLSSRPHHAPSVMMYIHALLFPLDGKFLRTGSMCDSCSCPSALERGALAWPMAAASSCVRTRGQGITFRGLLHCHTVLEKGLTLARSIVLKPRDLLITKVQTSD